MNLVLYLTNRIKYKWPKEYSEEFIEKLKTRGHNISIISDDTEEQKAKSVIYECDYFIGVKGPFDEFPSCGKRVFIRAASSQGEGPLSTMQCAGCEEKLPGRVDCLWEDELCMKEVTPNDVLEYL